jgi:thiamine pyrophosphate-dependent acetolactate synthase large subunit-like protein
MDLYGGGLVVRTLERFGVKHVFSLPGHQTLSDSMLARRRASI